jgi:hypothetical protein
VLASQALQNPGRPGRALILGGDLEHLVQGQGHEAGLESGPQLGQTLPVLGRGRTGAALLHEFSHFLVHAAAGVRI